jgi:hypothetical protein
MLIKIGLGISLKNLVQKSLKTAKRNKVWVMTKKYSDLKKRWPNFLFANYRTVVKHFLKAENFELCLSAKA